MSAARLERFRAVVRKQAPNPYVDVPVRVSRAFAARARSGRIRVVGKLEGVKFRGTLVPAAGSRHRLFLSGGYRAAAGVKVGKRVTLELHAVPYDEVRPPRDVAAALGAARAGGAFDALTPSHRHEILRWIEDAKTPATRQRRIRDAVERITDRAAGAPSAQPPPTAPVAYAGCSHPSGARAGAAARARSLWTCPRCGNQFVNRNSYHSCRRYDLSTPFTGKPAWVRDLFDRFRAMVEAHGPVTLVPYRDRVGFMVRVRFAGAVPKKNWLDVGFWLPRRVESPRFHRVETITPGAHAHVLRVTDPHQLDAELAGWIREAYAVGCQEHLAPGAR